MAGCSPAVSLGSGSSVTLLFWVFFTPVSRHSLKTFLQVKAQHLLPPVLQHGGLCGSFLKTECIEAAQLNRDTNTTSCPSPCSQTEPLPSKPAWTVIALAH